MTSSLASSEATGSSSVPSGASLAGARAAVEPTGSQALVGARAAVEPIGSPALVGARAAVEPIGSPALVGARAAVEPVGSTTTTSEGFARAPVSRPVLMCFRACRGKKEGRVHPHPTPHSPRTHHATCPALCIPKVEGNGVCRGTGASEKKSRCATKRRPPPHTPTCNIAWIACMGRFVRAQNRLFISLADQAPGSHLPNSILHWGVRGRQVASQSRRLFFSLAPESVFFL